MISNYLEASILALIQGFSEFIPVSSSAHLILVSKISSFNLGSLQLDICLHLGSLIAILFYFKKDIINLFQNRPLVVLLILGSVPLILIGFIFHVSGLIHNFRSLEVISWTTFIFALVLYFADKQKIEKNLKNDLSIKNVLIIGFFQVLAIIPGVSRAGITITASRFLNFDRVDSSKIAFYLSIPALSGASVLGIKDLFEESIKFDFVFIFATFLSFIFSYLTIKYFLIFVKKFSLKFFVFYRIFLALILFYIVYF